nr:helix-turn-helix transcriptional regulator [Herbaspirillum aquaticum]
MRAVRLESKLSQENLAFNAQFDRAFISDIERGVANPSIMALATLCYALNITLADLFATINLSLKPGDETRRKNPAKTDSSITEKKKMGQRQVPKIR